MFFEKQLTVSLYKKTVKSQNASMTALPILSSVLFIKKKKYNKWNINIKIV